MRTPLRQTFFIQLGVGPCPPLRRTPANISAHYACVIWRSSIILSIARTEYRWPPPPPRLNDARVYTTLNDNRARNPADILANPFFKLTLWIVLKSTFYSAEMAKYGGGNVYHFPNYHILREPTQVKRFEKTLCRYLTRKIGFEAVLRIRCTKGNY